MNENLNPERDSLSNIDLELDKALRPKQFDDFSGQPKVVDNLRVFDLSMMPNIIAGNTNAPAMAIADQATDMMLERIT